MAGSKVSSLGVLAVVFLAYAVIARAAHSPAQAPAPSNDGQISHPSFGSIPGEKDRYFARDSVKGTSIDQGIAYVLMLVALVLTYIIH
ncbi:hypothetical protein MLD38_015688 [Melastoma candidum]|uniref:Uncharacterized protein n=1 Tax=Melastoma candidum TaxID=119954 RepID=A0ACB9RI97_9MYRT|nr:hypothetical protein MLD38_015688 [Melastoma candidum]